MKIDKMKSIILDPKYNQWGLCLQFQLLAAGHVEHLPKYVVRHHPQLHLQERLWQYCNFPLQGLWQLSQPESSKTQKSLGGGDVGCGGSGVGGGGGDGGGGVGGGGGDGGGGCGGG